MPPSEGHLDIFYRPVIDPRDEQVMIYRVVPVLNTDDGTLIGAKKVIKHRGKPMDSAATVKTAERNVAVLQRAAHDIVSAHNSGNVVFVMIPINAMALNTKESTTLIVKALKDLPAECSKAAIIHLFNLPERVTLNVLDDVLVPLLISIDKFVIEPPAELESYDDIGACNAQGVVLDMDPDDGSGMDLKTIWARATLRKLGLFVQNATDEGTFKTLERYEGRGIDGPLFGELLPKIGPRTSRAALSS